MRKIELLAPAGSLDILKAAVDMGADAVYLGLEDFNARINATNFTFDDLLEGINYAHLRSSLIYLTCNTLIKDDEFPLCEDMIIKSYQMGVDAFIIQDIGLVYYLANKYPDIPIHCSTQMNIYSNDDFEALANLNICRVVLPRELSVEEIKARTERAQSQGIETEVFVQGAACISYSGLCLMSAMNKSGTRSGNRGLCAQPCREEYSIYHNDKIIKTGHLLSSKDRSALSFLPMLIKSGVASLKIEGRMRDIDYVRNTVRVYRTAIDSYYDKSFDDNLIRRLNQELLVSFNRGGSFTSQYLSSTKDSNQMSGEYVGKYGIKIGFIRLIDSRNGKLRFNSKSSIVPSKGDYLSIRRDNKEILSFPIGKIFESGEFYDCKGVHPDSMKKLLIGDEVYLMNHSFDVSKSSFKKTHINISINITDSTISLVSTIIDGINKGLNTSYECHLLDEYMNHPLDKNRIDDSLRKTGNTPFIVDEIIWKGNTSASISIALLNDMRRQLLSSLETFIINNNARTISEQKHFITTNKTSAISDLSSIYYFPSVNSIKGDLRRDSDLYAFSIYDFINESTRSRIIDFVLSSNKKIVIVLPNFIHDNSDAKFMSTISRIKKELGDSFLAVMDSDLLSSRNYKELGLKHFVSPGANIFNKNSILFAANHVDAFMVSYELPSEDLYSILKTIKTFNVPIIVHSGGFIPWMSSDHCFLGENKSKCNLCSTNQIYSLKMKVNDDKDLVVLTHNEDCSSEIWGPNKDNSSNDICELISDLGYNIVSFYSEI